MAESSSCGLPPRKKPQSDVQEYFEAEKKVKCLLCNPHKEIVFHGGTTNLCEHFTSQHTFDYSTTQQSKPLSLTLASTLVDLRLVQKKLWSWLLKWW